MFSFTRMIVSVSVALALTSTTGVLAVPVPEDVTLVARASAVPSPAFVVYTDAFVEGVLPPASKLAVSSLVE